MKNSMSMVSKKGAVVIPADVRKRHHLIPGQMVVIVDYGGRLSIIPATENPIQQGRGLLKNLPSLTDDLRKERIRERSQEEGGPT